MGRIYASELALHVPSARLVAVGDTEPGRAEAVAKEFGVPRFYEQHAALLEDPEVDAVVIITSTSTHRAIISDAAAKGKAIFCEKPLSTSMDEAARILAAVQRTGVFFQMGFQRRFDSGYRAAKEKIEAGVIGTPMVLKSTSRDPYAPPMAYCDPKVSGGLIIDMGIHDMDVARMFMGDVKTVHAAGACLANPEMIPIGDIDNAVINLVFESGALGCVQLSRNSVFGYDIRAEIWGTKGSLQIGYLRETPLLVMTEAGVTHDVVPYFMQRFEKAYRVQIQDFVDRVLSGREPAITCADGVAALRVSVAATKSAHENRVVAVSEIPLTVSGANA